MPNNGRLEVQFNIEALIFIDAIVVAGFVLPLIFPSQDLGNSSSALLVTSWGLLVVLIVNAVVLLYIFFVTLPTRMQNRFEFSEEDLAWDGALNLAEEIQLLEPGIGHVGIFPSVTGSLIVEIALLADLAMMGLVEVGVERREVISFKDSFLFKGDFDPILRRVYTRFLEDRDIKNIYDWIRTCVASRISLNEGLISRLVRRGFLRQESDRRSGIFKVPSFSLTEAGQARGSANRIEGIIKDGKAPESPREQFFTYLSFYCEFIWKNRTRSEKKAITQLRKRIVAVLPPTLKAIASAMEVALTHSM